MPDSRPRVVRDVEALVVSHFPQYPYAGPGEQARGIPFDRPLDPRTTDRSQRTRRLNREEHCMGSLFCNSRYRAAAKC